MLSNQRISKLIFLKRQVITSQQQQRNIMKSKKKILPNSSERNRQKKIDKLKIFLNQTDAPNAFSAYGKSIIQGYNKLYEMPQSQKISKILSLQSKTTSNFMIKKNQQVYFQQRSKLNALQREVANKKKQLKNLKYNLKKSQQQYDLKDLKQEITLLKQQQRQLFKITQNQQIIHITLQKMKKDRNMILQKIEDNCKAIQNKLDLYTVHLNSQIKIVINQDNILNNFNKVEQNQMQNNNEQIFWLEDKLQKDLEILQQKQGVNYIMNKQLQLKYNQQKQINELKLLQQKQQIIKKENEATQILANKKKIQDQLKNKRQKLQNLKKSIKISDSQKLLRLQQFLYKRKKKMNSLVEQIQQKIQIQQEKIKQIKEQLLCLIINQGVTQEISLRDYQNKLTMIMVQNKHLKQKKQNMENLIDKLCTATLRLKYIVNPNQIIDISFQKVQNNLNQVINKLILYSKQIKSRLNCDKIPKSQILFTYKISDITQQQHQNQHSRSNNISEQDAIQENKINFLAKDIMDKIIKTKRKVRLQNRIKKK